MRARARSSPSPRGSELRARLAKRVDPRGGDRDALTLHALRLELAALARDPHALDTRRGGRGVERVDEGIHPRRERLERLRDRGIDGEEEEAHARRAGEVAEPAHASREA